MSKAIISLKVRTHMPDGARLYVNPAYTKNKRLKPNYVIIYHVEHHRPGGIYTWRFQQDGRPVY